MDKLKNIQVAPVCEHHGGTILTVYGDGEWEPYDDEREINGGATIKARCNTCGNITVNRQGVVFRSIDTGELC